MRNLTAEHRIGWAIVVVVAIFMSPFIIRAVAEATRDDPDPIVGSVLSFTACAPDVYETPAQGADDVWEEGPEQGDEGCETIDPDEPIVIDDGLEFVVEGQVCNRTPFDIAATLSVEWVGLAGLRFPTQVVDVPVVYRPGCHQPYEVIWRAPEPLLDVMRSDLDERWRIVGIAEVDGWPDVRWDSVKTFEVTSNDR